MSAPVSSDTTSDVRRHAALSDCEEIRPGFLGQPANALSSLAFVAAAVPIWRVSRRPGRRAWALVAAASALEGLGSVLYHGPGSRSGKVVHGFALEGDLEPARLSSMQVEVEWPPRSGRRISVPEIDRVLWADPAEARRRLNAAQSAFVDRLLTVLARA